MELLDSIEDEDLAKDLIVKLNELETEYQSVEMEIIPGEVAQKEVDGNLIFEQTEKSIIHIAEETLVSIIEITSKIRNDLLSF